MHIAKLLSRNLETICYVCQLYMRTILSPNLYQNLFNFLKIVNV